SYRGFFMACLKRYVLLSLCLTQCLGADLRADVPLESINSKMPEYGVVEGPDGYYFSRGSEAFGTPGKERILFVPKKGGLDLPAAWGNEDYSEGDPYFSPDGNQVCFISDRPDASDPHAGDADIWCALRSGDDWLAPQRLPEPVNSAAVEFSPVLARDGGLYFASNRDGGLGMGDLYRASQDIGGQWQVENLGRPVNTDLGEWNLDISPNGELLVFEASHRSTNLSVSGDLYLSRRTADGWSSPVALSSLNTTGSELMPRFHSDSIMTYASSKDGDAKVIEVRLEDFWPVPAEPSRKPED
ncbi:MAG TPA: hypothetical protein VFG52_08975, partial [Xanthomonadales bacterium]|nr:hypothetical protein [Xanthomonadales bacterium]